MASTKMDLRQLYVRVGRIAVHWAHVEMALNQISGSLFALKQEKCLELTDNLPLSLKKNIIFLRKAFKNFPELTQFMEAFALLDRCGEIGEKRNSLIHNAALGVANGRFKMRGLRSKNTHQEPTGMDIGLKDMDELNERIIILALDMSDFANRVVLSYTQQSIGL